MIMTFYQKIKLKNFLNFFMINLNLKGYYLVKMKKYNLNLLQKILKNILNKNKKNEN